MASLTFKPVKTKYLNGFRTSRGRELELRVVMLLDMFAVWNVCSECRDDWKGLVWIWLHIRSCVELGCQILCALIHQYIMNRFHG